MPERMNFVGIKTTSAIRIADLGGWTDTWFAQCGSVASLSVYSRIFGNCGEFLGVDVIATTAKSGLDCGEISIIAADPTYNVIAKITDIINDNFDHKNLLLASLSLCPLNMFLHDNITFRIQSPIPPGASMGTSASVSTALIKSVFVLANSGYLASEIAKLAFRAETEVMGGQSGTQDQWTAAYSSGANEIVIDNYPETRLYDIPLSSETRTFLNNGLVTVFVGQHNSSQTHMKVISEQENKGPDSEELVALRKIAPMAVVALRKGDTKRFGELMKKNTKAQEKLCSKLVSENHRLVIKHANRLNCLGYKVNGAGGEGGSVTLLFSKRSTAEKFVVTLKVNPAAEGFQYFEHQIAS